MKSAYLVAAVMSLAAQVHAGSAILTLENGDDGGQPFNTTYFTLTNTSAAGVELTGMSLTIGDSSFNYDFVYARRESFSPAGATATLLVGDRSDDGGRTELFTYGFTGFGPSTVFTSQFDIDPDGPPGAFEANARTVLFSNGPADNAVLTLNFTDGDLVYTFPDFDQLERYSISIVPEPTGLALLAAPVMLLRRKR